jgi:hypothetical protein
MPLFLGRGLQPLLKFKLNGSADALRWKLYSRAMVALAQAEQSQALLPGWGQLPLDLPSGLAADVYYLQVHVSRGPVDSRPVLIKLMVLR